MTRSRRRRRPPRRCCGSRCSGRGCPRGRARIASRSVASPFSISETAAITMPGVQYPHCSAWWSWKACCTGCSSPFEARPSIVVITAPSAWTPRTVHDLTDSPSSSTVQAPHDDVSQPTFVPVSDEALAQHVDEQVTRLDLELVTRSVDGQRYRAQGRPPSIDGTAPSLLLLRAPGQAQEAYRCGDDRDQGDRRRTSSRAGSPWRPSVRPDRAGSVGDYVDWKRQAEDMAWFVASLDGEDAGAALAYVGWHSAPGTGTGEAFVLPEHRGAGVGSALYRELAGWVAGARLRHARDDRRRGRRGQPRLGRPARLPRGRPQLAAGARPHGDRGPGRRSARGRRDRDLGGAARPDAPPCTRSPARRTRTCPARRARRWTPTRTGSRRTCSGDGDRPEATFIALADGEVAGYAKLSLSSSRREGRHATT